MRHPHSKSKEDIEIDGFKYPVTITITYDYDECFSADDIDFEDSDDKAKFVHKLNTGDIMAAVVKVSATLENFEGSDILGGVLIEQPGDLQDTINEHGMIDNAKADLAANMENMYNSLKLIFNRKDA